MDQSQDECLRAWMDALNQQSAARPNPFAQRGDGGLPEHRVDEVQRRVDLSLSQSTKNGPAREAVKPQPRTLGFLIPRFVIVILIVISNRSLASDRTRANTIREGRGCDQDYD